LLGRPDYLETGRDDVYVLKLDKNGNKQWEKTFDRGNDDWANAVIQTQDGGYLIVGTDNYLESVSQVYVLKLDKNGKKQWERRLVGKVGTKRTQLSKRKMEGI
jgi:hypothetical protein